MKESTLPDFTDNKYFAWLVTGLFFIAGIILTFSANGTCDDGDSIMHYQFARWAIVHHRLFFDHWAKPLYVLIACPFAQFGIPGIKIFNLLVSSATILLTFYIAENLNLPSKALAVLFMVMSPGLIVHSLSGLTEPLFALVLSASVLLYLRNRIALSVFIISFLPFVRSEGLIICGVFALMLIIERRWKLLPVLLCGHVVYSLAGYTVYGNLLWVFTRIPYARLDSVYGHGTWEHFFINLPDIIGIPLYLLLVAGLIAFVIELIKGYANRDGYRRWVLVYGCFIACFFAHVLFWRFGIFNSLGLLRVLIGVLPMMAIIQLQGLNALAGFFKNTVYGKLILYFFIPAVTVFPFMRFESSLHYQRDFCLTTSQLSLKEATDYVQANFSDYRQAQYYYDANYVAILLNLDIFDTAVSRPVWGAYEHPPKNDGFIIWDNYYSAFENKTRIEVASDNSRFELVKKFTLYDRWNFEKTAVLFRYRKESM